MLRDCYDESYNYADAAVGRTGALVIVEDSLRSFGMGTAVLLQALVERRNTGSL